jgi:hypothetical protein
VKIRDSQDVINFVVGKDKGFGIGIMVFSIYSGQRPDYPDIQDWRLEIGKMYLAKANRSVNRPQERPVALRRKFSGAAGYFQL